MTSVMCDESVRFNGFEFLRDGMPPTLYVDDWTVLREVSDVCKLRAGDHCVVGDNLLHRLWRWSDATSSLLTSYGINPFYHHFVVLDSVACLSQEGEPLTVDGQPCRIVEFSDTFPFALGRLISDGYSPLALLRNAIAILRSPARLHMPPLMDYLELRGRGVFVVSEDLSAEQRSRTVDAAIAIATGPAAKQPSCALPTQRTMRCVPASAPRHGRGGERWRALDRFSVSCVSSMGL